MLLLLFNAFNNCFQVFFIEQLADCELFINPKWRPCFHIIYLYVIFFFLIPKFIQLFFILDMERLSPEEVSNLMPEDITVNDNDIDLYTVNYDVCHNLIGSMRGTMVGPNVMLSSSSKRPTLQPMTWINTHFPCLSIHPSYWYITMIAQIC